MFLEDPTAREFGGGGFDLAAPEISSFESDPPLVEKQITFTPEVEKPLPAVQTKPVEYVPPVETAQLQPAPVPVPAQTMDLSSYDLNKIDFEEFGVPAEVVAEIDFSDPTNVDLSSVDVSQLNIDADLAAQRFEEARIQPAPIEVTAAPLPAAQIKPVEYVPPVEPVQLQPAPLPTQPKIIDLSDYDLSKISFNELGIPAEVIAEIDFSDPTNVDVSKINLEELDVDTDLIAQKFEEAKIQPIEVVAAAPLPEKRPAVEFEPLPQVNEFVPAPDPGEIMRNDFEAMELKPQIEPVDLSGYDLNKINFEEFGVPAEVIAEIDFSDPTNVDFSKVDVSQLNIDPQLAAQRLEEARLPATEVNKDPLPIIESVYEEIEPAYKEAIRNAGIVDLSGDPYAPLSDSFEDEFLPTVDIYGEPDNPFTVEEKELKVPSDLDPVNVVYLTKVETNPQPQPVNNVPVENLEPVQTVINDSADRFETTTAPATTESTTTETPAASEPEESEEIIFGLDQQQLLIAGGVLAAILILK